MAATNWLAVARDLCAPLAPLAPETYAERAAREVPTGMPGTCLACGADEDERGACANRCDDPRERCPRCGEFLADEARCSACGRHS